jgi:hypothetical protein
MSNLWIAVVGCFAGCAVDDAGAESRSCSEPPIELVSHGQTEIPASAFCAAMGDVVYDDGAWSSASEVVQLQAHIHSSYARTASGVRLRFVDSPSHGGYTVLLRAADGDFGYGFVNTGAHPEGNTGQLDASFQLPHVVKDATVIVQLTTNGPYDARLLGVDITTD